MRLCKSITVNTLKGEQTITSKQGYLNYQEGDRGSLIVTERDVAHATTGESVFRGDQWLSYTSIYEDVAVA